ncbi:MAG: hypothetical protein FWD80_04665 [Propionibacteriaceae bacterium]|nr:hypothetical protein [Propionibacteriaceae bacterium]
MGKATTGFVMLCALALALTGCSVPVPMPSVSVLPSPSVSGTQPCADPSLAVTDVSGPVGVITAARRLDHTAVVTKQLGELVWDVPVADTMVWDAGSSWAADDSAITELIADNGLQGGTIGLAQLDATYSPITDDGSAYYVIYVAQHMKQSTVLVTCQDGRQARGTATYSWSPETSLLSCAYKLTDIKDSTAKDAWTRFCP